MKMKRLILCLLAITGWIGQVHSQELLLGTLSFRNHLDSLIDRTATASVRVYIVGTGSGSTGGAFYRGTVKIKVNKDFNEDHSDSWLDLWFDSDPLVIDKNNGGSNNGDQTVNMPNDARSVSLKVKSNFDDWDDTTLSDTRGITLFPDNTGPSFTLTTPATWASTSSSFTVSGTSDRWDLGASGSGISASTWAYSTDHSTWTSFTPGTTVPITGTAPTTVWVKVSDVLGNVTEKSVTVLFDTAPPTLSATVPAYASGSLVVSAVTLSDPQSGPNLSSLRYAIDGGLAVAPTLSNSSFTVTTTSFAEGSHVLTLSGKDNIGVSTSVAYSFSVDRTAPSLSASVPASVRDTLVGSSVSLQDTRSGPNPASFAYWFDQTAPSPLTVTAGGFSISTSSLTEGSHSFSLSGADFAGNTAVYTTSIAVDRTGAQITATVPSYSNGTLVATGVVLSDDSGVNAAASVWWLDTATKPSSPSPLVVNSGTFTIVLPTSPKPSEGSHTLYIEVSDTLGNSRKVSYPFVFDSVTPALSAVIPAFSTRNLNGTGLVFADNGSGVQPGSLVYWFDQSSVPPSPTALGSSSGAFAVTVPEALANGAHTLFLMGSDRAGNVKVLSLTFSLDITVPVLSATFPSYVLSPTVTAPVAVSVTSVVFSDALSGAGSLVWWLDNATKPSQTNAVVLTDDLFTAQLSAGLSEGAHTFYLQGTDVAGNAATVAKAFTIARTPPTLGASLPLAFGGTTLSVTGLSASTAGIGVPLSSLVWRIDSGPSTGLPLSSTSAVIPLSGSLAEGTANHVLSFELTDAAGNFTILTLPFGVDRTAPTLSAVLPPYANASLAGSSFLFNDDRSGTDASSLAWQIDGGAFSPLTVASGSFAVPLGAVEPGPHTVVIQARDNVGNLGQTSGAFTVDRSIPVLTSLGLTEDGATVGPTDYLHGGTVELSPLWSDASPVEQRSVLNVTGITPSTDAQWQGAAWRSPQSSIDITSVIPGSLSYLYVQSRDAAGNLSAVSERVIKKDNSAPGTTDILSTTHPRAITLGDAVAQTTALFRLSVGSTGPGGLKAFEWKLYRSASEPNPNEATDSSSRHGTTQSAVSLPNLTDNNETGPFYWLAARALGGNGKNGVWSLYRFRIDTSPPTSLTVTSSTHPLGTIAYQGSQISFEWNKPLDMTGVKSYYYRVQTLAVNAVWQPVDAYDDSWTATGQTSLLVPGLTGSGRIGISVAAMDWAGNIAYSHRSALYDNVAPSWTPATPDQAFSVTTDFENRTATVVWSKAATDDVSTPATGLIYGIHLQDITASAEASRWEFRSALPASMVFAGLVLDHAYLLSVSLIDGAGNQEVFHQAFTESDPAAPQVTLTYTAPFEQNWGGWKLSGTTGYTATNGVPSITGQSAVLSLAGTPLTLTSDPGAVGLVLPALAPAVPNALPIPNLAAAPSAAMTWATDNLTGTIQGISLSASTGLSLDSLTVPLPLADGAGHSSYSATFPQVAVGPAPGYVLRSGQAALTGVLTLTNPEGWVVSDLHGAALSGAGWTIEGSSKALPVSGLFAVSSDAAGAHPLPLTLQSGAFLQGRSIVRAPVDVPASGLFVTAGNLTIRVVHAVVEGDRLSIALGYALLPGLSSPTALELGGLSLDTQGRWWADGAFQSKLTGPIVTDYGTLSAAANAFVIQDNQLVLSLATLYRAGLSPVTLTNLPFDQNGMGSGQGTAVGEFEHGYYQMIFVKADGGRIVNGVRIFDSATVDIPVFGVSGLTIYGLGISLADDRVVLTGTAQQSVGLQTGYGAQGIQAASLALTSDGVKASLSALLPAVWGGQVLPLGNRSLAADGSVGTDASAQYPSLLYKGFTFEPHTVSLSYQGLAFDDLALASYSPTGETPRFSGLILKSDGSIVSAGTATGKVFAAYNPWVFTFDALRIDASGVGGEPLIDLPAALGGIPFRLGTTTLLSNGTFTNLPSTDGVQLDIFGWSCVASSLALDGPNYRLGGATVLLPGLMQGNNILIGTVVVDNQGGLVSTESAGLASFRGTNGFRVQATGVGFSPRGLVMGGKVFLPESLGGAANIPAGKLFVEPDGAVIAEADGVPISFPFASWSISSSQVSVDRSGMTFHGNSVSPLGLTTIDLPDFTIYSTGELAVGGQSLASGSFNLPPGSPTGATVNYSGVRFDDSGVHLSASVVLPKSWGNTSVDFDDILITPQGRVSAATSLRDVVLDLDALGLTASFEVIRLSPDGFRFEGVDFAVKAGPLAGQSLAIDAALLDYSGNLDLYGFGFEPLDLYGYKVNLDSLSVGPTGFGFTGGIQLSESLPIAELQGAYLELSKFRMAYDGQIQEFKVSIDEGFSFNVYDAWTLGIQGLTIDKNLLTVDQATLNLPSSFNIGQLSVSGMTLNLQTGAIIWGEISVSGTQYYWNGLTFVLNKLSITPDKGLLFGGSVQIGEKTTEGTPYPELLQNKTFVFRALQILPSGLPGTIDASATNLNGPLFDENVLVQNGSVSFNNTDGSLIFGFTGSVQLGTAFMPGIAGLVLKINDLRIDVARGVLAGLDVSVTQGLPPVFLPGGLQYKPASLGLKKTGDRSFEVETTGDFLLGGAFPGVLKNRTIAVTSFVMESTGTIKSLAARLDLPGDNPLVSGLMVSDASISVSKDEASSTLKYSTTGSIKMGPGFLEGLSGLTLQIAKLEWDGAGSMLGIDVSMGWTGVRPFFGGSTIQDGFISLTGDSPSSWVIGMQGLFRLPATGLPEGLAGLGMNIQRLKFKTDGSIQDVAISSDTLNLDLFGFAKLQGGHLGFSKYDSRSLAISLTGNILLPNTLPSGLAGKTVNIQEFTFTTAGAVLKLNGSMALDQTIPLFAGINMVGASIGFSKEGIALLGARVTIPQTMIEGLPDTIALQKVLVGWDGSLKELAAGVGHAVVKIGGFTTDITNLVLSNRGVTVERAVLTLPPNLDSKQVLILNAGFDTSGRFTGTIGIDEISKEIAGFGLSLRTITFDVGAKTLRIQTAKIKTPKIGSLDADVQLNSVTISPSGVNLGGVGFSIPDYSYGGIGFRSIRVSFAVYGNTFDIMGSGQAEIPGLGVLDAELSFTNLSSVYPIGLKRAYFKYTLSSGIPLGTTGLFLNKIVGGFAYGPPTTAEMPSDLQGAFDQRGPRLQLGVGVTSAAGSAALQMDATFWVDVKNGAWAFDGRASVLSGLTTGRLGAYFGKNIFYGTFSFTLRFVNGQVQVWIFPYNGSTAISGAGKLEFLIPQGTFLDWTYYTPDPYWLGVHWDRHHIRIPDNDMPIGNVQAEFGQFRQGAGAKGWVSAFGYSIGAFVDGGGMHFNIGDYTLVRPGN